jgi:hypothetical protein
VLALVAGLVRLAPWLLDPSVTWRVAAPFARSLSVVALEAALALGWPLGWALATSAFVESGEARVLALLGERPARTASRLAAQGVAWTALLATVSWASARESTEPGRVVTELIADGKAACAKAASPRTYVVPFLGATWLCRAGPEHAPPRLVGGGPGPLAALVFSAKDARVSGDLGSIELDDAHLAIASPPASIHVDALRVHGAAPWGHGSAIQPLSRALVMGAAVALSSIGAVGLGLARRSQGRLMALVTGAVGPVSALGLMRALDRLLPDRAAVAWLVLLVPPLALAAVAIVAWTGARLPTSWHAASR